MQNYHFLFDDFHQLHAMKKLSLIGADRLYTLHHNRVLEEEKLLNCILKMYCLQNVEVYLIVII